MTSLEMPVLSVSPSLPAAPVQLVRLRKLLYLQASGTVLAGGEVSVGLLTSFCSLEFNEQEILDNLSDNNSIGRSETGDQLYRVRLQDSNGSGRFRSVTVKKLENEIGTVDDNLKNRCQSEVNKLGVIRHDNIISLVHCIERDDMILLLYEHMENGRLEEWLLHQPLKANERRQHPPLRWPERRAIAIGVAKGLFHLHHGCNRPIIHRNIKPSNILLDGDLNAKIAGFDLAQINLAGLNQPLRNSELPADSFGYTAPEYATVEVSEKVDVYSFGVLLLVLVTGRPANRPGARGHLATWARGHHNELMIAGESYHEAFERSADMDIPDRARHLKDGCRVQARCGLHRRGSTAEAVHADGSEPPPEVSVAVGTGTMRQPIVINYHISTNRPGQVPRSMSPKRKVPGSSSLV
ncbi:receptor-like protein kinase 5 [Miscanthus floridulus]|uniref:receptor-like protein kinase 5 n=1 Tax=Miscanthus floridulus TaxID=154761 RepID=UPI0034589D04